jgi:hypothetical protein
MPDAAPDSPLHYSAHPHIVERIVELSLPALHLRLLSRAIRDVIDRTLGAHLALSQPEEGRWLDWRVDPSPPSTPSSPSDQCTTGGLRLPTAYNRRVAAQIVDPALLLQRSFAGMLFRLPPDDIAWLESTLSLARSVSIVGDVWYGNRTLPFGALASVPARQVPMLRLLPALEREAAGTHYPSLHPFMAPRVEMVAHIPAGTRYDRAWVGMTTPLPPGVEEVRVALSVGAQEWGTLDRGRPLVYPRSVRRVDIALDVGALDEAGLRVVVFKLFHCFRPEIAWTVSGVDAGLLPLIARAGAAELEDVQAAVTIA